LSAIQQRLNDVAVDNILLVVAVASVGWGKWVSFSGAGHCCSQAKYAVLIDRGFHTNTMVDR